MKILLMSKDRQFCDRTRLAFAREGSAVRIADRQGIQSRAVLTDDVMLLHSANAASAARWCRVVRRVHRGGPLVACCDNLDSAGVATVLNAGADDVVLAAVPDAELLARVRAVCRRSPGPTAGQQRFGSIVVDPTRRGASINGQLVPLRRAEFRLLSYLLAHADRIVGARELIEDVLGGKHTGDNALLRVHLSQLRRKLGPAGTAIETVRGQGYRLTRASADAVLMKSA
ncbi:MAG TPA: response regulator transcription factor [Polyangia bacterium]|jgi:two-component system phosphate regulon response regulator PhoB|nr:response regulator transcription factor [Polyangia bacterium]